jgi:hypothetical protein
MGGKHSSGAASNMHLADAFHPVRPPFPMPRALGYDGDVEPGVQRDDLCHLAEPGRGMPGPASSVQVSLADSHVV